ncbi:MAG: hypothetical protein ABI832_14790 [bacterium]
MSKTLPLAGMAAGVALSLASPAAAYPVDCAILLCLAGGWPASIECAQARAVFIARITPWPVEPPLQIWNCPMHAALRKETTVEHLFDVTMRAGGGLKPLPMLPPAIPALPVADQADMDISDPAYDFVRSIRVYQTEFQQNPGHDGNCSRSSSVRLGTYGAQGDYRWNWSSPSLLPPASKFSQPDNCGTYYFRSVFVDWHDFAGAYGFEEVRY